MSVYKVKEQLKGKKKKLKKWFGRRKMKSSMGKKKSARGGGREELGKRKIIRIKVKLKRIGKLFQCSPKERKK